MGLRPETILAQFEFILYVRFGSFLLTHLRSGIFIAKINFHIKYLLSEIFLHEFNVKDMCSGCRLLLLNQSDMTYIKIWV
jgi:hypothetical protein